MKSEMGDGEALSLLSFVKKGEKAICISSIYYEGCPICIGRLRALSENRTSTISKYYFLL